MYEYVYAITNKQTKIQTDRQRVEQGDSETYKQIKNNNNNGGVLLSAELRFSLSLSGNAGDTIFITDSSSSGSGSGGGGR